MELIKSNIVVFIIDYYYYIIYINYTIPLLFNQFTPLTPPTRPPLTPPL